MDSLNIISELQLGLSQNNDSNYNNNIITNIIEMNENKTTKIEIKIDNINKRISELELEIKLYNDMKSNMYNINKNLNKLKDFIITLSDLEKYITNKNILPGVAQISNTIQSLEHLYFDIDIIFGSIDQVKNMFEKFEYMKIKFMRFLIKEYNNMSIEYNNNGGILSENYLLIENIINNMGKQDFFAKYVDKKFIYCFNHLNLSESSNIMKDLQDGMIKCFITFNRELLDGLKFYQKTISQKSGEYIFTHFSFKIKNIIPDILNKVSFIIKDNVKLLLLIMKETILFEKDLEKRYEYDIIKNLVSKTYEPYLSYLVEYENNQLLDRKIEFSKSCNNVYDEISFLFEYFKSTIKNCGLLTNGEPLWKLFLIIKKYISEYRIEISNKLSNINKKKSNSNSNLMTNLIDMCDGANLSIKLIQKLESYIIKIIYERRKNKIKLCDEIEKYQCVFNESLNLLCEFNCIIYESKINITSLSWFKSPGYPGMMINHNILLILLIVYVKIIYLLNLKMNIY